MANLESSMICGIAPWRKLPVVKLPRSAEDPPATEMMLTCCAWLTCGRPRATPTASRYRVDCTNRDFRNHSERIAGIIRNILPVETDVHHGDRTERITHVVSDIGGG